jgi:hypothetical protein
MVQRSGRFKTTHTGCYLSAKAYEEVRRFETALYGALFKGQSKKLRSRKLKILSSIALSSHCNDLGLNAFLSFYTEKE